MAKALRNIALVGNPNAGKTTLFNALTGMNQKTGNFPGVTVDKKTGKFKTPEGEEIQLIDLPGIYSLSPKSADEQVTCEILLNENDTLRPEVLVLVLDASNLKRNLFLATQIIDLGIPTIVALNMHDVAKKSGIYIDAEILEKELGVPVTFINAKRRKGISAFKSRLKEAVSPARLFYNGKERIPDKVERELKEITGSNNPYIAFKQAVNHEKYHWLTPHSNEIQSLFSKNALEPKRQEILEISERYQTIAPILENVQKTEEEGLGPIKFTKRLDKVLTRDSWGYLVFFAGFFVIFQAVFTVATIPMDWIDAGMGALADFARETIPPGLINDFLVDGVIAGIAGVVIFIPQIMILFGLIEILEETGYMARVGFLNDRLLRAVGMNGKSVVPLVSGFACAVPAIMAARSIEDWKERLITIMVTPLMSCSARLPVYVFLVGFVVPDDTVLGFISLQGLFMLGLYLLGLVLSGFVAWVFNRVLKSTTTTSFFLELPTYRAPKWRNVGITMYTKGLTFVTEAGKIIVVISMVLWVLATYGPADEMQAVRDSYTAQIEANPTQADSLEVHMQSDLLATSFIGQMGHLIEPVIRPLGYDWKMGIAIVTSFAAREVFVGTMSILYSVEGGADNISELQEQMKHEIHPATGEALMSVPTASSLLIFFVIAMQCMSTLAITKRETNSWKWPIVQFVYLTVLAYAASFITYQALI